VHYTVMLLLIVFMLTRRIDEGASPWIILIASPFLLLLLIGLVLLRTFPFASIDDVFRLSTRAPSNIVQFGIVYVYLYKSNNRSVYSVIAPRLAHFLLAHKVVSKCPGAKGA